MTITPSMTRFSNPTPYNHERPHRALELRPPQPDERQERAPEGEIRRRDRLGGLIHEYYRAAA